MADLGPSCPASDLVAGSLAEDYVRLEVSGPGTVIGHGSANPSPDRSFLENVQRTYHGRVLAAIRALEEDGAVQLL